MTTELSPCEQAFELLLTCADQRLNQLQSELSTQVTSGAFEAARELLDCVQELAKLREELSAMAEQYQALIVVTTADQGAGALPRGMKTPQYAYRAPILKALVDLGGEARLGQVLERVRELMDSQLNAHDLMKLSDGKSLRWRNTGQWARNQMREEGLIRDDSPRGIWAISEKGRAWLKSNVG